MAVFEKSIEVEAPVRSVYNQWTQFEEFPRFMEGVKEVRQLGPTELHWRAEIGGKDLEWTAKIFRQEPDRHIGWRSTSGEENGGNVHFDALGANRTRVTLTMQYEPKGAAEKTGSLLGIVERRVKGDLERFKEYIESRGRESGGWRGEIREGRVTRPDAGPMQERAW